MADRNDIAHPRQGQFYAGDGKEGVSICMCDYKGKYTGIGALAPLWNDKDGSTNIHNTCSIYVK